MLVFVGAAGREVSRIFRAKNGKTRSKSVLLFVCFSIFGKNEAEVFLFSAHYI
jgi:hypothetical protein